MRSESRATNAGAQAGRIQVVGIGPGDPAHMTPRAREAIVESDVVVGYQTYLRLIPNLLAEKTVVGKSMTEELDRVETAYSYAREGYTVALISSGDAGVYGMAGPMYELLLERGWSPGEAPEVEVIPGATALSACGALLGAPLSHDFCAISLSDLLTPWAVIARRLDAAARADFVIALYNPGSKRRRQHIQAAQEILLRHRAPETPVAVVRSAYREQEEIERLRLDTLHEAAPSMLSTVIIGNSATIERGGIMVTPRGYAEKYSGDAGEPAEGEAPGQSLTVGLEQWPGTLRRWLREQPAPSLAAAARAFEVSWGEALAAVADDVAEPETPYRSSRIDASALPSYLDGCAAWPWVRAVVAAGRGAQMGTVVPGGVLRRDGHGLLLGEMGGRIDLSWEHVAQGWALAGAGDHCSVELVDAEGTALVSLIRVGPAWEPSPEAGLSAQSTGSGEITTP